MSQKDTPSIPTNEAEAREYIRSLVGDALEADKSVHSIEHENNIKNIHSSTSMTPVGAELDPVTTVEYKTPNVDVEVTVREPKQIVTFEDEPEKTSIIVGVDQEDSEHDCIVCGNTFDRNEWEELRSFGDLSGSTTVYDCPNCEDGTADLIY